MNLGATIFSHMNYFLLIYLPFIMLESRGHRDGEFNRKVEGGPPGKDARTFECDITGG